jgi:hypothetical protein
MSKHFSAALTQHVTRLSGQTPAHIVVLAVDRQLPTGPDGASKSLLMDLGEPAVRVDCLGNAGQCREGWEGHTRRLVATRARLVRPLAVVVGQERLGEGDNLREGAGPMYLQAFLTKRAMKSLDVGIFVWAMRWDHIRRYPYTPEKAHQRRGEIASGRATDQAWVIVKGEYAGQAMLAEKLGHHLEEGFGIELAAYLAM